MTSEQQQMFLYRAVRLLCSVAAAIAMLALAGYLFHATSLIALLEDWQGMSALTATAVILVAASLWRTPAPHGRAGVLMPALVVLLMSIVLGSHVLQGADVISPVVAESLLGLPAGESGRVSVATGGCLLLLGVALLAGPRGGWRGLLAVELCANAAFLVASMALLGYAYRVADLYGIYVFNTMSLQSALSIACLAAACLLREPESRLGMALRSPALGARQLRAMLALTALPPVLGWLLLRFGGELGAGNGAGMALLVMATGVPMFYLLLENARSTELLERERKAQQALERRLSDDLQARLDRQTAALADSHRREVDALARTERTRRTDMIAQLTGSIAHDFNNLLMVIGGSAQLLKLRMPHESPLLPLVDKVSSTVTAAARLTGQLSAFSRTQRLDAAPVHVDTIVRQALADTATTCPSGVQRRERLAGGSATLLGDAAQLQLAVVHLIRNGCEAIAGSGVLQVQTALRRAADGSDQVAIVVIDDGAGMTPEQVERATEPFFTTRSGVHHGLGLAQVNSVVQQTSGVLHIDSTPGQGTRVELVFPCFHAPSEVLPAPQAAAAPAHAAAVRRPLLVIDDDDEVRGVIVALLRQMGYDVVEAADGETGLRLLAEHTPSLAIIDYLMPGMNGAEVARRARQQAKDLSIIFISGYSDSQAIDAVPHSTLLKKPVLADDLARTVAHALEPA